ncbi:NAD-dependent epimerase/dehydratase family protein [Peribacillus sp. NPDC097225]|uniref:NAD-dependent epimerase/dehydratase family protein n=1 Tax=Peribacillus sp. NPDC097225 TaxID=3364400 RepID=UPI0038016C57
MKRILITGLNSYVGNNLGKWLENYPDEYSVDFISLRDNEWKDRDFSGFDVVFHVAGIAHVSKNPKMEEMYYKINRDLTVEVAKRAKSVGVKQFVFMSSIIVYGNSSNNNGVIDRYTIPKPIDFYGRSKLQAEDGIKALATDAFKVAIIRPPMIYGKNSKGNFPKLAKVALKTPLFPELDNRRSMLHVDNLCEFIRVIVKNEEGGTFFPQNKKYVKTSEMVKLIAEVNEKNLRLTKIFNPVLKFLITKSNLINKVFGNLIYDQSISRYKEDYQIRSLRESIELTIN